MNLSAATDLFKVLGDPTRVRLLALLSGDDLTVAELTRITRLTQSRVSTHLKKLRGAGKITEDNIKDAVRQTRLALLEADVNYRVVKQF